LFSSGQCDADRRLTYAEPFGDGRKKKVLAFSAPTTCVNHSHRNVALQEKHSVAFFQEESHVSSKRLVGANLCTLFYTIIGVIPV
jgi:hypothetical protein